MCHVGLLRQLSHCHSNWASAQSNSSQNMRNFYNKFGGQLRGAFTIDCQWGVSRG